MIMTIQPIIARGCQPGLAVYGLSHPIHAIAACRSCDSASWCWATDRAVEAVCSDCDEVAWCQPRALEGAECGDCDHAQLCTGPAADRSCLFRAPRRC